MKAYTLQQSALSLYRFMPLQLHLQLAIAPNNCIVD